MGENSKATPEERRLKHEETRKAIEEIKKHREDQEARIKKNALAFLKKCKGEDLTIYEVEKTIEEIQSRLKWCVTLGSGLKD